MGFFKNIGKAVKKNVSLKNIVKIATPLVGAIPIVGGVAQSITEKTVQAREEKKAQNQYNAELLEQQAKEQALQLANVASQSVTQNISDSIISGAYNGFSTGAKNATAKAGVTIADMTITEWFKKHWLAVTLGVASFFTAIYMLTRQPSNVRRRRR